MVLRIWTNQTLDQEAFRGNIYRGEMLYFTDLETSRRFVEHAKTLIEEHLGDRPREAHLHMPVDEFVGRASKLKSTFTNSPKSKELINEFLGEMRQNPSEYLFDVPRLRVVPPYHFLSAGVSYAYKPHRDTWYGAPPCQINTWMPVFSISPDQTMHFNTAYFQTPVSNTSCDWDLKDWIENQRSKAKSNVQKEARVHPVPTEELDTSTEMRFGGRAGDMVVFSGTHIHGTVPNKGNDIRFSVDFRVFHLKDIEAGIGAPNADSGCKNVEYGFKDYFHAEGFAPYSEDVN